MANYKKLTDVEVMEEVSESTMALVEDNGKLKKVPCGAGFGGGGNRLIIRYSETPSPISLEDDDRGVLYSNMTYSDFYKLLYEGDGCDAILLYYDTYRTIRPYYCCEFCFGGDYIQLKLKNFYNDGLKYITFYNDDTLKWTQHDE